MKMRLKRFNIVFILNFHTLKKQRKKVHHALTLGRKPSRSAAAYKEDQRDSLSSAK